jgi:hypothetical protein
VKVVISPGKTVCVEFSVLVIYKFRIWICNVLIESLTVGEKFLKPEAEKGANGTPEMHVGMIRFCHKKNCETYLDKQVKNRLSIKRLEVQPVMYFVLFALMFVSGNSHSIRLTGTGIGRQRVELFRNNRVVSK